MQAVMLDMLTAVQWNSDYDMNLLPLCLAFVNYSLLYLTGQHRGQFVSVMNKHTQRLSSSSLYVIILTWHGFLEVVLGLVKNFSLGLPTALWPTDT